MKAILTVVGIKRFDGDVTNNDTGEITSIDNSCKLTVINRKYVESDVRLDGPTSNEKHGLEIIDYKAEYPVFFSMKEAAKFPCNVEVDLEIVGNKPFVRKAYIETIKLLELTEAKAMPKK